MKVRSATPDDVSLIFSFIQKKLEFDRNIGTFSGVLQASEEKIHKTLFGIIPFSYVLFAAFSAHEVGFALYGFRSSSFAGRQSIWLDDLYVDDEMRSQGVGAALMAQLAQTAKENDCTHLDWNADARNSYLPPHNFTVMPQVLGEGATESLYVGILEQVSVMLS